MKNNRRLEQRLGLQPNPLIPRWLLGLLLALVGTFLFRAQWLSTTPLFGTDALLVFALALTPILSGIFYIVVSVISCLDKP